jgi:hypothetical protein
MKAAAAAHAAAREVKGKSAAATAAARAAGHAVATAPVADHCLGAALYALKAVEAAGASADGERGRQVEQLPEEVRELVVSALASRFTRRNGEKAARNEEVLGAPLRLWYAQPSTPGVQRRG